ncbi:MULTISPECIES: hypothetical protein [unclassified Agarivorans]|nr:MULTISPECIES: hypothetical protein [unclassified Agarivorans]MDO6685473.1 hypothetical protein [Agarivorans sp. 3_MG-2023]MDO6715859.1 hypothetical protein [Agarivorans sp. 2_MG-2023]MDO6764901.1 hypothetical protein [Agarivorans sp. 1_MG-2023]GDY25280.1 hypothetical protein AHAT_11700 [Agarivorans sp. Toyoura001]
MSEAPNMLPAIDILMCHTGASFLDACQELGVDPNEMSEFDPIDSEDK